MNAEEKFEKLVQRGEGCHEFKVRSFEYPRCPRCGGPVAGAMMTSESVNLGFGTTPGMIYYHPNAISVYCVSADCNWDHKLSELKTPVPA